MFSELKEYDVRHALKKANGDFQTALDDLLNVQFLQSTGQQQRGIDAFFEPEEASTTGKKKKKNKNKKSVTKSPEFAVDSTSKEVIEKSQAKELKRESHNEECHALQVLTTSQTRTKSPSWQTG